LRTRLGCWRGGGRPLRLSAEYVFAAYRGMSSITCCGEAPASFQMSTLRIFEARRPARTSASGTHSRRRFGRSGRYFCRLPVQSTVPSWQSGRWFFAPASEMLSDSRRFTDRAIACLWIRCRPSAPMTFRTYIRRTDAGLRRPRTPRGTIG